MGALRPLSKMAGWSMQASARHMDLVVAGMVVLCLTIIIVPLPPAVLDLLLAVNITAAVSLLMVALYVSSPLELATFPTILLLTTLLRLSLNIASTRLILLHASAGDVIEAFGALVVQGDVVVGGVLFVIITIVQLLVLTKGAERVAEVGARFTLDAMPGKQMSIDADLRAGTIDQQAAQRRRAELSTESQLYGAMDGAMKFVKGDAIAGLVITAINFVGGLALGVLRDGLEVADALRTYSLLTIGDGLVSQIPALLISIAAGILITRVSSDPERRAQGLGAALHAQITAQPKALVVAGAFLLLIALVPGLPFVPFAALGLVTGVAGRLGMRPSEGEAPTAEGDDAPPPTAQLAELEQMVSQRGACEDMLPMVTPILVELAPALYEQLGESSSPLFTDGVRRLRDALFFELGVRFPNVRTRANPNIARADGYIIYVHEIPVSRRFAPPRKLLVSESPARLRTLNIAAEPAVNPASDQPSAWVKSKYKALLDAAHIASWPSEELILLDLGAVLRRHAAQFIGVQDVQVMLDRLEGPFPALIRETVPRALSVTRLTDLLRRLVDDGISVRDLKGILQSIAQWSSTYDDNLELVEQIRCDMRGYVTHKYARGGDSLRAYIFDATIEDTIRGALTRSRAGVQLDLDPEIVDAIQRAVAQRLQGRKHAAGGPVFLTAPDLRAVMQGLLRRELPDVSVLSFQELDPALVVEPVARIRVDA